jgi:valyl-tRNA synthetase
MSKSLDNILDPLDVIAQYGTDALRLALTSGTTPGNDFRLGEEKLATSRNLVNKLWNISRYIKLQEAVTGTLELRTPADHFIANQFEHTRKLVTKNLEEHNLSLAIEALQRFTIFDFADWYIELHKFEKNTPLLQTVFQELITLWHPFIPFVSEAIYQELFTKNEDLLMVRPWPTQNVLPSHKQEMVDKCVAAQNLVTEIRNLRSAYHIPPAEILSIQFVMLDDLAWMAAQSGLASFLSLAKVSRQATIAGAVASIGSDTFAALLFLGDNFNLEKERARMLDEIQKDKERLTNTEARLANSGFIKNASSDVLENTELQVKTLTQRMVSKEESLAKLM